MFPTGYDPTYYLQNRPVYQVQQRSTPMYGNYPFSVAYPSGIPVIVVPISFPAPLEPKLNPGPSKVTFSQKVPSIVNSSLQIHAPESPHASHPIPPSAQFPMAELNDPNASVPVPYIISRFLLVNRELVIHLLSYEAGFWRFNINRMPHHIFADIWQSVLKFTHSVEESIGLLYKFGFYGDIVSQLGGFNYALADQEIPRWDPPRGFDLDSKLLYELKLCELLNDQVNPRQGLYKNMSLPLIALQRNDFKRLDPYQATFNEEGKLVQLLHSKPSEPWELSKGGPIEALNACSEVWRERRSKVKIWSFSENGIVNFLEEIRRNKAILSPEKVPMILYLPAFLEIQNARIVDTIIYDLWDALFLERAKDWINSLTSSKEDE